MNIKKIVAVGMVACTALVATPSIAEAKNYTKEVTLKRGSFFAWSKDVVTWTYNGKKVVASEGDQSSGGALLTDVESLGITKRTTASTRKRHVWRGKKKIRAGVTLGSQTLGYTSTIKDDIKVYWDGDYIVDFDV